MNFRILVATLLSAAALLLVPWFANAQSDVLARLDSALPQVAAFEHGRDAGPLNTVEQLVIDATNHPEHRQAVEERLIQTLNSATTRDAKSFLCRQLRTIGTARSVSSLEALLPDPDLSHMARYALGRIEDPAAAVALHRALHKTSGATQVGVINTLGARRHQPARPDLIKLLQSTDPAVAAASATALGAIGGGDAIQALQAARQNANTQLRFHIDHALLLCADQLLADGRQSEARAIYQRFQDANQPRHLQIAALRGLVEAGGPEAVALLTKALQNRDPDFQAIAIGLARAVPGPDATAALAAQLPSLAPPAQELLLGVLGARGHAQALPAIQTAAASEHENVRLAALEALGQVGNSSVLNLLARTAACSSGREQQVARSSLAQLPGDAVDGALLAHLSDGDPAVRRELIRALAARQTAGAVPPLLNAARDPDEGVRREALGALGELVSLTELDALVQIAAHPSDSKDLPVAEQAVETAFLRVEYPAQRARPLLAALRDASAPAQPALVRLLSKAGTPEALAAVRAALQDQDPNLRDAAVRSLSDWPSLHAAQDLLDLALVTPNQTHQVLALRGYIRLAALSDHPTRMYQQAMQLAKTHAGQKLVLAGLGTLDAPEALDLVEQYLRPAELRDEAASAAVQIAGRLRATHADRARAALQQVLASVQNERLRGQAQEMLNEIDQYEGYILNWEIAGPFQLKGKESREVFDAVFPPEKPEAKDVAWQPLKNGLGSWEINLETALGSHDHCAAYLRTRVWSPQEQPVRLELGSDDAIKVWLNAKEVHTLYTHRGVSPRQDRVNAALQEGWNDLLLKVVDHAGGWACCCRIRRPDGTALEDLRIRPN